MDRLNERTITFAAGASTSNQVDFRNEEVVAFITDAALTSATLTFTDSHEAGATKLAVLDAAGAAVTLAVVASRKYLLSYLGTEGLEYVTLTSSTPQVAATTITVVTKVRA
jgi:hypothetical protein